MPCSPIANISLDLESRNALDRIAANQNLAKLLGAAINIGVFNSIFTKNKAPVSAYNITQTDWDLYSKAMAALPAIQKSAINKEIDLMILHYQIGKYDYKHVTFWKGMKDACK